MKDALEIGGYRESDREALGRFLERVWAPPPLRRSDDWLDWQLFRNPYAGGEGAPLVVARHRDVVVGMLIMVPTPMWVGGKEHRVAWGRDLYVMPEYRRHRIGMGLIEHWIRSSGAALTSGHSETMRSLQEKHGWTRISRINQREKLYYDTSILRTSMSEGLGKTLKRGAAMIYAQMSVAGGRTTSRKITHRGDFDARAQELWVDCRSEYSHIGSRELKLLRWRFVEHPYYRYLVSEATDASERYCGYVVTRCEGKTCWIVDMLSRRSDSDTRVALIAAVEQVGRSQGVTRFISRSVCAPLEGALRRRGFLATRFDQSVSFKSAVSFPQGDGVGWYVTGLDSDLDR